MGSYAELLAREDIDAVYVPLPAALHAEWTERALLSGKHVFVEKPLTTDPRETEWLIGLARERGLLLLENMMFVHHPQHDRVDELASGGSIGELRSLASGFTIPPKPPGDIRYQAGLGGGVLSDPAGVTAQLSFGMERSYRTDYELRGSSGVLSLDRVFTPPVEHNLVVRVERQDHREEIVLPPANQFANIVHLFATAVENKGDLSQWNEISVRRATLLDEIRDKAECVHVS